MGHGRASFEHLEAALRPTGREKRNDEREVALQQEVETLRAKVAKKDKVIAEISAEYVQLRNELGEL